MSEPSLPLEAELEWKAEERRHLVAFSKWITRWPGFRRHAACGLLGSAIATADMIGVDVEAFLAELRRVREPRPSPLIPPRSS